MSLPNLSGTGRLTADVELRYSAKGTAVASLRLAFNSRRRDEQGNWSDGDTFYVRATVFGRLAENAAESFAKGHEVVVSGRLKTDEWSDKQDGSKRSAPSLLLDSIGGSCSLDTVTVHRMERSSGGFGDRRPTGPSEQDPWNVPNNTDQTPEEAPF